jgi:hypothetical protein
MTRNRHHNSVELSRHRVSELAQEPFYEGVNFEVGDFVLVARTQKTREHKLTANWRGPFRVREAISDHIYQVEHLISGELSEVHTSRMKFYCDDDLDSRITLQLVVQKEEDCESNVESIKEVRYVAASASYAFKVHWQGFDDGEETWEDPIFIQALVPEMVRQFVAEIRVRRTRLALEELLGLEEYSLGVL